MKVVTEVILLLGKVIVSSVMWMQERGIEEGESFLYDVAILY